MRTIPIMSAFGLAAVLAWGRSWADPPRPVEGPAYAGDGRLVRPADYREWVYVTSGLGMTYGPAQPEAGRPPRFDNVFVNRPAYREFLRSGTWPDETIFILEIR